MCGIVGYVGPRDAWEVIVPALKRLEYRGYDSAGVALLQNGKIQVQKDAGRVDHMLRLGRLKGHVGLGHTRWATHGAPNQVNAHPHVDCKGQVAVIHNGIIENYRSLKEDLVKKGHKFVSETDTEVVAHLLEDLYDGDFVESVRGLIPRLKGAYALVLLHKEEPDKIITVRRTSPIVVGLGQGENFVASDIPALLKYTRRVVPLGEDQWAVVGKKGVQFYDFDGKTLDPKVHDITWSMEDAEKGGYDHFMLKEIHDTPKAIHEVLLGRIHSIARKLDLEGSIGPEDLRAIERVRILACGTSFHAGLLGRAILEKLVRIPVQVEVASEYRYSDPVPEPNTLVIAVSQSGETADTLAALKLARKEGHRTLAITNVVGSSITRSADAVFQLHAGPEISVAATKSFINQTVAFYLLGLHLASLKGRQPKEEVDRLVQEVKRLPRLVQQVLDSKEPIRKLADLVAKQENAFYIGRGLNHPTALEGALKMKEISYIHAEGFAAGELKHGPLALLSKGVPVVALTPRDATFETIMGNIGEVRARAAVAIAVAAEGDPDVGQVANHVLSVPACDPLIYPVPASVALQLLAYYAAKKRGAEIDKPRNLAKSVTVE